MAAGNIQTDADRSLMKIGTAAGGFGGKTHHGHGRITLVNNNPDVGNALVAVIFENVAEVDKFFNDGNVILSAQTVEAA